MPDAGTSKPDTEPLAAASMTPGPAADEGARPPTVKPIDGLRAGARRIEERLRAARRWWRWATGGAVALVVLIEGVPWVVNALTTVSTNDAFVSGHVTFVAPRVTGQVARVLVDDNNRVHAGDLLVELDKEPYQVALKIAQAAVETAQADLVATQAKVRALEGQARSQRFALAHAT